MRPRCGKCGKENLMYVNTVTCDTTIYVTVICQMCGSTSRIELLKRYTPNVEVIK